MSEPHFSWPRSPHCHHIYSQWTSTRSRYIHDLRMGRGLIRADYWQILLRQPATRLSFWPLVHPVTCTLEGIWGFVSVQHLTLNFISISCYDYKLWPIFWGGVQCAWLILSALASWFFARLRYVLKSSNVHHIERGTSHKDYAKDCFTLNVNWEHLQWVFLIVSAFVLACTQAPAFSGILIPGFSGRDFCKIPGSRDFSGRD